jgi:hypothetical protein
MNTKRNLCLTLLISVGLISSCCHTLFVTPADQDVAALEEYLIDFSKKIAGFQMVGGDLPTDLNADKFFAILTPLYSDDEMIRKVGAYPVIVNSDDASYALMLCDKRNRYILYRDLGKTIDYVDDPYWRQGKKVACPPK